MFKTIKNIKNINEVIKSPIALHVKGNDTDIDYYLLTDINGEAVLYYSNNINNKMQEKHFTNQSNVRSYWSQLIDTWIKISTTMHTVSVGVEGNL